MNTLMNWLKAFEEKETQQCALFKYISYTNEKEAIWKKGSGCRKFTSANECKKHLLILLTVLVE